MTDDNLVGQTLAGKYRVESVLGKGGMGLVLGARHLKLDEPVAIKILRPAMMEVDGMVSRFLREARAASKIKSVHVARVTDVDTLEDGVPYMVMEHLTGIDFSELRKKEGQLRVPAAVGYLLQACEAIAEAHSLGIVHRDLKPSNLFLHKGKDGKSVVKVLDFGISKIEVPGEQDTTKTGQMMGSPKYMSPEQMLSMRDVDGRSDIWSLGAMLYELTTGRPPFVAETTPRICALVLNSDPALPSSLRPDLPIDLERVILRCLEKEADRRYATVGDLMEALDPFAPPPEPVLSRSGGALPLAMGGPERSPQTPPGASGGSPPVASAAAQLPSVTPTPGVWDADTKLEGAPKKPSNGRRAAAVVLGVMVLAGATALLISQRAHDEAIVAGKPATTSGETAAAPAATPTGAPSSSGQAPRAYSLSDLPDVRPAITRIPGPMPSGAAAPSGSGPLARPKPTTSDPFGGRRN